MEGRFVVLLHTGCEDRHYDLMVSNGDVLATWQFGNNPVELGIGESISGRKLPDHRIAYLDYEGPVGEDRGYVTRIDGGAAGPTVVLEDRMEISFHGSLMKGDYILFCRDCGKTWELKRQAV